MAKSKPLPPLKHLEKLVRLLVTPPGGKLVRQSGCGTPPGGETRPPQRGCGTRPGPKLVRAKARAQGLPGRNTDADILRGTSATAWGHWTRETRIQRTLNLGISRKWCSRDSKKPLVRVFTGTGQK